MIPDPWWKRNPDGDAAESARRRYGDEYDIAYWNGGGIIWLVDLKSLLIQLKNIFIHKVR